MFIVLFFNLVFFTMVLILIVGFLFLVDEKEKQATAFWSCLQDIQKGLQVSAHIQIKPVLGHPPTPRS
jgi:preprotein translocase subunit YajC